MSDTSEGLRLIPYQTTVKAVLSMLPCFFFLYINGVMMFALLRKPLLLESSRYILFGHLLVTDSLQLLLAMLLYIFVVTRVRMVTYVCFTVTLFACTCVKISPFNLAVMSLERYVAICFPLRHPNIATPRTTGMAIVVMWTMASLDSFIQLLMFISLENFNFDVQSTCRKKVLRLQVIVTLDWAFIIIHFVVVSMIIIYTYIAIMMAVRSASSNASKANKAHKTVLLHLLQLCLCLTSTLFNMINSSNQMNLNPAVAVDIQYILFIGLIIFPKCLSPLIYGLRDQTFSHVFKYYFTFGFKTNVSPFPKF